MSIYEYNEEQYKRLLLQEGEERGIKRGKEIGISGMQLTVVQKKIAKGKSVEVIADEMEEPLEVVQPLYQFVMQHTQAKPEELVELWLSQKGMDSDEE